MRTVAIVLALAAIACVSAQVTPQTNYKPVNITVNSAPFDVIATPITPNAPYSQRAFQCNVTGDSRFPAFASGTYPLTIKVPAGQRVRVIFANGNLNGNTVTQTGEPGVIVQQGGAVIVQQVGSASPIVQTVGSPIVQQAAPAAALTTQTTATVVQQNPSYPQSPVVQQSSPVVQQSPATTTPAATPNPPASPVVQPTPAATPAATTPAATTRPPASPVVQQPATPAATTPAATSPAATTKPASPVVQQPPASPATPAATTPAATTTPASAVVQQSPASPVVQQGRKLLQDRVPGGPNNGLVEYVALLTSNTVPGFVVPNTQFGVPYVEFTASAAAAGQTASFQGLLEVAQVIGGVPQYPFRPNPSLSPECQVNVNFQVA